MQNSNLLQKVTVAGLITVSGWFFLTGSVLPGNHRVPAIKNGANVFYGNDNVYKMVSVKEINKMLASSKLKKVTMSIYPVKLSGNVNTKDFALRILFQDAGNQNKILGANINSQAFKKQTKWYVQYLKANNVPVNKIPYGYYIPIDKNFLKNAVAISVMFVPDLLQMSYDLLGQQTLPGAPTEARLSYDSCKCPPDCCGLESLVIDSPYKCPPICYTNGLPYQVNVKSIIAKAYK